MRKNGLLMVLVVTLFGLTSCTYDYFEDETTYQVFVPEVLNNTVSDCRVLVYNKNTGALVAARYATYPEWNKDTRISTGLFSFKLPPGEYNTYCYTNTENVRFVDDQHMEASAFILNDHPFDDNYYVHPSDIRYQKLAPVVEHPAFVVTDTVKLERYTGRITVRFKNFPGDVSRIRDVQLRAEGVSVMQYLKDHNTVASRLTTTTRLTEDDRMYHLDALPVQTNPEILEVDHTYMPSIENIPMELNFSFLTDNGLPVIHVPVSVRDKDTGQPLRLMSGERIIIEIDTYTIVNIGIVGWDEDIESGKDIELG